MISKIALLVKGYDEAIDYYTQKLGFELVEDTRLDQQKRWVVVSPGGRSGSQLLLAKAATKKQAEAIGNQTGGRVFLFLHTDNFWDDYQRMLQAGVKFTQEPRSEGYGTVAVFEDLYGNLWDLIQPV